MEKDLKMDLEAKNRVGGGILRRRGGLGRNREKKPSFKEVLAEWSRLSSIDSIDRI